MQWVWQQAPYPSDVDDAGWVSGKAWHPTHNHDDDDGDDGDDEHEARWVWAKTWRQGELMLMMRSGFLTSMAPY